MEPWKRRSSRAAGPSIVGFNGATAMEPWKSPPFQDQVDKPKMLQWGHGDGAVEEQEYADRRIPTLLGFNGATAMEPWKRPKPGHKRHR